MDISNHAGYTDYEWAIEINRFCLSFIGVWPENNETKQKIIMSNTRVIVILNIVIWSCTIPSIHSLFRIWGDIMSVIDNLQYTLPLLMATIKLFIMWLKKNDILPLINMIKDDWLKSKTLKERQTMMKRARLARILAIFGCCFMSLSFIMGAILPMFGITMRYITNRTDPGRLVPLQSYYYIYDRDKSPYYEITYVAQCVGASVAAIMYTGTDSFLGSMIFHICGQLENLKARIIGLDKFNNFEKALSYNVQDHKRLLRSISIIDNIFNLMLLGALVYFGILFAFYGFLFGTIITQGRDVSVPRSIFILTAFANMFAHTCLYCVLGEILITQCESIYTAACEYKWYTLEPKGIKNLLIIMIRAKKSSHLTAGRIFPMNMATLCNLLKTSSGYISVLLARQ